MLRHTEQGTVQNPIMKPDCQRIIAANREQLLDRWLAAGLDLLNGGMAASSPAGATLSGAMAMVLDDFEGRLGTCGEGIARLSRFLAIQPVAPSSSLSLFGRLEQLLAGAARDRDEAEACRERVGQLLLEAFDRFMESREVIYRMKVEESQRKMHMMLRRAVS
jgi:hypothetical protein